MIPANPPKATLGVVLVVDDVPENLAMLHNALECQGYVVRVATSGARALESARLSPPDLILLDAAMPGLDGFETCRQLKRDLSTRHIPVVFMTGLVDSEDVVRGFQAGGIDYVIKPARPLEVLARIASHLRNSRLMSETLQAADAAGDAIVSIDEQRRVSWATPMAHLRLKGLLDTDGRLPRAIRDWLALEDARRNDSFTWIASGERLVFSRLPAADAGGQRLLIQKHAAVPEPQALMQALKLTAREAEVLYWVVLGKTNPDIAVILEMSPRTVNKHLEHIFLKLGVETRTAAATLAMNKGRAAATLAPASAKTEIKGEAM